MTGIYTIIVGMIALIGLDLVWLQGIARSFYQKYFPFEITFNFYSAVWVYFLLALGMYVFIFSDRKLPIETVAYRGAMLGLITYGVYDFTNMATLKNWSLTFGIVDILWGTLAVMFASIVVHYVLPILELKKL